MGTALPTLSRKRRNRLLLTGAGLLIGVLLFVPPYLFSLFWLANARFELLPGPQDLVWGIAFTLDYGYDVFFSDPQRYLLASLLSLVVITAALVLGHPGWRARLLLALAALPVLAMPLVFTYAPALSAAPGREMVHVTKPNPIEAVARHFQLAAEIAAERYRLLGWDGENTLYYRAEQTPGEARILAFKPGGAEPQVVAEAPAALHSDAVWPSIFTWVRGLSWLPSGEEAMRAGHIKGKHMTSPDRQWIAVVSRHFYGPEDVLLLRVTEADLRALDG